VTRARVEEFPALARENALLAIDKSPAIQINNSPFVRLG
jgi:hypothetical protein